MTKISSASDADRLAAELQRACSVAAAEEVITGLREAELRGSKPGR
jgi:hypothetical protein